MGTTFYDAMRALHTSLVAAFAADANVSDVTVFFGGPTQDVPPNTLHVGYTPDDGLAVDGTQTLIPQGYSEAREETYDITLTSYTLVGDSEQAGAFAAADKSELVYKKVEATVAADTSLGNVIEQATMGARFIFNQGQLPSGAGTTSQFTVSCLAYPADA